VDLDGDGIPDILSGSWPGQLYFFKGLGKGKFAGKQTIKDKTGKNIKIESASTIFAVDWNGDGKLDLLVGDVQGRVHLLLNEGTSAAYAFGKPQELAVDGKPIRVEHGDSHPIAVDWDGDKLLDLLVGCGDGSVLYYKNIGTKTDPKLAKPHTLVAASQAGSSASATPQIRPGTRVKICAVDWNGDGRLDLLVGDFCQYQAKIDIPEKDRKVVEEARSKLAKLMKDRVEFSKEFSEATNGPQKKETPAEAAARKQKLDEATDKYQDVLQGFQQDLSRLAKLNSLATPNAEQEKEMASLRKKLDATKTRNLEIMEAVMPYQFGPFDEPPEKTKARWDRIKAAFAKQYPLLIEMTLLQEITQPYDANQMAGSVWLYLRQEARRQK
jgi:hypothetical protein